MKQKTLFLKYAYVKTGDFTGVINLDEYPARGFVEDLSFLRSSACFEVMEAKGNVVFHEDDHLDRLSRSAFELGLSPKFGPNELKDYIKEAVQKVLLKNNVEDSLNLVRVYLTGGYTHDSFFPSGQPNLFIFIQPYSFPKLSCDKAIKLMGVDYTRELPHVKTTNYLMAQRALPYATGVKHYDNILYTQKNKAGSIVLEGSTFNFFTVKSVFSPGRPGIELVIGTAKDDILPGVTRDIVIKLARKRGYTIKEGTVTWGDVVLADELFVTSTTKLVWPVSKVDSIEKRGWPVTLELREDFLKYRREYYNKAGG